MYVGVSNYMYVKNIREMPFDYQFLAKWSFRVTSTYYCSIAKVYPAISFGAKISTFCSKMAVSGFIEFSPSKI